MAAAARAQQRHPGPAVARSYGTLTCSAVCSPRARPCCASAWRSCPRRWVLGPSSRREGELSSQCALRQCWGEWLVCWCWCGWALGSSRARMGFAPRASWRGRKCSVRGPRAVADAWIAAGLRPLSAWPLDACMRARRRTGAGDTVRPHVPRSAPGRACGAAARHCAHALRGRHGRPGHCNDGAAQGRRQRWRRIAAVSVQGAVGHPACAAGKRPCAVAQRKPFVVANTHLVRVHARCARKEGIAVRGVPSPAAHADDASSAPT